MTEPRTQAKSQTPYSLRMAKVFADPLRIQILAELNTRDMSPKQFFEEFGGGTLPRVSRHFDVLDEYDWIYLVRTESGGRRRGGIEHFYRATGPAVLDENDWSELPESVQNTFTRRAFATYAERVKEAMEGGTMDARDDRHFTWTPVRMDQRGWEAVIAKVNAVYRFLYEEQDRAKARLEETGEDSIPMTVALAVFESPKNTEKAP